MTSRLEKNKKKRKKIEVDEKIKKTKTNIVNFFKIFLGFTIIILCILSYIYYTSTMTITIREYSPIYSTLPKEYHGLKIVQFSDLYFDNNYTKTLEILKEKINILKPDLVLFTGGLINKNFTLNSKTKNTLEKHLSEIKSTIGKYYVVGKDDDEQVIEILNNSNFKFLDDESELIYSNSSTPILIHGINNNYNINYNNYNKLFKINMIHDAYKCNEVLKNTSPEIIMTGKTLNGQIRIPFQEELLKNQNKIVYKKNYTIADTDIFITGGIGTNNIPIRIFNSPSINFYRLRTQ